MIKTKPVAAGYARWLACLGVLAGTGCVALCGFEPGWPFWANLHAIEPGMAYRSAQLDPILLEQVLDVYGIKTVINLRGAHPGEPWWDAEKDVCDRLGVVLVNIPMSADELPSREALLDLYNTFLDAEYPILIHCRGGADRTGAASAIWRMTVLGEERSTAMQELSICYGHVDAIAMDYLAEIFQPDEDWILNEYDPDAYPP